VPAGYRTPNGSRFKARALQYALEASPLPDHAWIVHMDEETQLTYSAVLGIRNAIAEEEDSGRLRIGQGAILYHRRFGAGVTALFLSLADMIRTGDDLGRFHFQHRVGMPLFGLHGSYILTRNDVEREVGFDVGPEGSITEDAFWALAQMARGRRCRWVEGYMVEQPPAGLRDFLKQRRRWLWGLLLVLRFAPAPWWGKLGLAVCVGGWALSWLGIAAFWADLGVGQVAPWPIRAAGDISLVCFYTCYLVGLAENLRYMRVGWWRRWVLYALQVILIPAFTLLEATAVVYGLATRGGGTSFHVIAKPAQVEPRPAPVQAI
jgi:egghead protein (zeste-white 4 protein)